MSWVPFIENLASIYNASIFLGVQSQGLVPDYDGPVPIHVRISMTPHEDFSLCTDGIITFMAASNSLYRFNVTSLYEDWSLIANKWTPFGCFFAFEDVPGFGTKVYLIFKYEFYSYITYS
jgi:hypothetical protein